MSGKQMAAEREQYRNTLVFCLSFLSIAAIVLWVVITLTASQLFESEEPVPGRGLLSLSALVLITMWGDHQLRAGRLLPQKFILDSLPYIPFILALLVSDLVMLGVVSFKALETGGSLYVSFGMSVSVLCLVSLSLTVSKREWRQLVAEESKKGLTG